MNPPASGLWVYLSASPLTWLTVTLVAYWIADRIGSADRALMWLRSLSGGTTIAIAGLGPGSAALWVMYLLTGLIVLALYAIAQQWQIGSTEESFVL